MHIHISLPVFGLEGMFCFYLTFFFGKLLKAVISNQIAGNEFEIEFASIESIYLRDGKVIEHT